MEIILSNSCWDAQHGLVVFEVVIKNWSKSTKWLELRIHRANGGICIVEVMTFNARVLTDGKW